MGIVQLTRRVASPRRTRLRTPGSLPIRARLRRKVARARGPPTRHGFPPRLLNPAFCVFPLFAGWVATGLIITVGRFFLSAGLSVKNIDY